MPKEPPTVVHTLNISEDDAVNLLNGKEMTITSHHLSDARIPILLTKAQMKGIEKASQTGSGFKLKFSPGQIDLHTGAKGMMKMEGAGFDGMGFWGRLWRRVKKIAKGVYNVVKPIAKPFLQVASQIPIVKEGIEAVKGVANAGATIADSIAPNSGVGNAIRDTTASVSKEITGSGLKLQKAKPDKSSSFVGDEQRAMDEFRFKLLNEHRQSGGSFLTSDGRH